MFNKFSSSEIVYTKLFSDYYEDDQIIRFYDNKLPDMYIYNYTLIKNCVSLYSFRKIILGELEQRKNTKASFLRIEFNFPIEDEYLNNLPVVPKLSKYDYMYIEPAMSQYLFNREGCIVKKAVSEEVLKDGIEADILANTAAMGIDFARRRIYRKSQVYNKLDPNFNLYVCYYNDIAIGNCELMLNNHIGKIEDFDILDDYQRKGFGTSVIMHLLEEAKKNSIEFVYLITGSEDTAKEMYKKCGFKKIGEKMELFFDFS